VIWKFSEETQIAHKYIKQCSTSLGIKEMQIQTHQDSISPQSDWQSSRKQTTNIGGDAQKQNPHTLLVGT
jgi:hypothetical protein